MNFKEIKGLTIDELRQKLLFLRQDYFESKMKHSLGELLNTNHIRQTRRDIARIQMALNIKEKIPSAN